MNTHLTPTVRGLLSPVIFMVALVAIFLYPFITNAATFNVADGDVAGLIQAINDANNNGLYPGADTIRLAENGTYTLLVADNPRNGFPRISSEITLNGRGSTIQRSNTAPSFRFFQVLSTGDLTIKNVLLTNGRTGNGGALFNSGGKLKLNDAAISASAGTANGGAIFNDGSSAELIIVDSTISGNVADNNGGGIFNSGGDVTIRGSLVSNNVAARGGGVYNNLSSAQLTIINSTISGNTAQANNSRASAIANASGTTKIISSTIVDNHDASSPGEAIYSTSGTTRLKNSVVANNDFNDCFGTLTSGGYNLVETLGTCTVSGGVGDIFGTDPMLGALADNGGPTMTHLPLVGSPVIDAVPLAECTRPNGNLLTEDQRNLPRQVLATGLCEIGSVEVQPPVQTLTCGETLLADTTMTADLDCTGYLGTALIMGADNIFLDVAGHTLTADPSQTGVSISSRTGVTVKSSAVGGTIRGGSSIELAGSSSGISLADLDLSGTGSGYGVYIAYFSDVNGLTLDNVTANNRDQGFANVSPTMSQNVDILNSTFNNNAQQGLYVLSINDLTLSNVDAKDNAYAGALFSGVTGTISLSDVDVTGSARGISFSSQPAFPTVNPAAVTFGNNSYAGVELAGSSSGISLADLDLSGTGSGYGVYIAYFSDVNGLTLDNVTANNHDQGFANVSPTMSQNVDILNSTFNNNAQQGLYLNSMDDVVVSGNTISSNVYGLYLSGVTNYAISHNNIYGNTGVNVYGDSAYEVSSGGEGNYWGHACPTPFFVYGGVDEPYDSNSVDVVDSFGFGVLDGWLSGSPCSP